MRGFATGVGSKADIGVPPLTQILFMSPRPGVLIPGFGPSPQRVAAVKPWHDLVAMPRRPP